MDAERLAELRAWADRLEERAENEETRAEARAIRMLTDEVEILQQKLAAATAATAAPATPATADPADSKPAPAVESGVIKRKGPTPLGLLIVMYEPFCPVNE